MLKFLINVINSLTNAKFYDIIIMLKALSVKLFIRPDDTVEWGWNSYPCSNPVKYREAPRMVEQELAVDGIM